MTDTSSAVPCGVSTHADIDAAIREAAAAAQAALGRRHCRCRPRRRVRLGSHGTRDPARPRGARRRSCRRATRDRSDGRGRARRRPRVRVGAGRGGLARPAARRWIVPLSLEYAQTPDGGMFSAGPTISTATGPTTPRCSCSPIRSRFPSSALIKPDGGGSSRACRSSAAWPAAACEPGSNTLVVGPRTYESGAVGVVDRRRVRSVRSSRRAAGRSAGRW